MTSQKLVANGHGTHPGYKPPRPKLSVITNYSPNNKTVTSNGTAGVQSRPDPLDADLVRVMKLIEFVRRERDKTREGYQIATHKLVATEKALSELRIDYQTLTGQSSQLHQNYNELLRRYNSVVACSTKTVDDYHRMQVALDQMDKEKELLANQLQKVIGERSVSKDSRLTIIRHNR
jgi:septation ring formation regulator EzrA